MLVVATPCPLILATPVAIIGGINRAARGGILFRTGGALEQLAQVDTVAFDKTGTITGGRPAVAGVCVADGWRADDVLRLAAAVERSSGHLLARSVVDAAKTAGLPMTEATAVTDTPGRGVSGTVDGQLVSVGAAAWIAERHPGAAAGLAELDGRSDRLAASVAIDGAAAGFIDYADQLRPDITAEAADVVLLSDDLSLVPSAVETSRRTIRIARESIVVGLGLSAVAMGFAAAGHIVPAVGALLQEGIDVVVILNALRTAADRR